MDDDFSDDDVLARDDVSDRDADSEPIGSLIVNWRTLADADAAEEWTKLREWVEWVRERYYLRDLTACWWKHGAAVEELSSLHTGWLVSFDEADSGYGPLTWHDRFAVAFPRVKETLKLCSDDRGHREPSKLATWAEDDEWAAGNRSRSPYVRPGLAESSVSVAP